MIQIYYMAAFVLSLMLTTFYVFIWRRRYEVNITILFLLIPVMNYAYLELFDEPDLQIVLFGLKIVFLGGCFFPWFISLCILDLCGIRLGYRLRFASFALCAAVYCSVLTIGEEGSWFYKTIEVVQKNNVWIPVKEYGFMHTVFYAVLALFCGFSLWALIYTWRKKKQVSRQVLDMLFYPHLISVIGYLAKPLLPAGMELTPLCYVYAQLIYLVIVQRMELYHVSDMAIESMARSGDTGFISLDFQYHYLGSNEAARHILPVLEEIAVDNTIIGVDGLEDNLLNWLAWFKDNENTGAKYYSVTPAKEENKDSGETEKADETAEKPDTEEEKPALTEEIYRVQVRYLHDGTKKCGYQIILTNDTQNQKYIRLLTQYRAQLQDEVAMKTASIIRMHDNLIMSMAAMVESRDNSTGGHIKRTSVCVRILIDEILKLGTPVLTEEFCRNIIKAAPMHDLGKIAVDDAILRKPGRFEPEEYEKMKAHAAEGARIVHEILKDTDDKAFHHLAENVAHYHHERWDGSGYPDGLKGEEIPLEARIMAIADVYDALVSKRVYKESMSFEEADRIISEGMGTHFDPQLRECYEKARPRLEQFYRKESLEEEEKARQEARDRTEAEMKEEKKGSEGSRTGQVGTVNE